jgi:hypothetical protein
MNVVHGDSLDDAVHLTLALSSVRRSAEAVTVNGRQPHVAYSVVDAVNGYDALSAYAVPFPFADVFHPLNVYPERVIAPALSVRAVAFDALWLVMDPLPPFASKDTAAGNVNVFVSLVASR